ncbi:hypothetical protein GHK86_00720 [Acidimicrobiaceae bacterium USS-CC1]|uniref:Uncharacterized protein n=1 Tax=Acidiferrimicrobium australe TaxID=2664430 RepID=A0ABW9QPD6_9ACTN|nr:hypothetical protein [Acidiferrimicrobium australe]
MVAIEDEGFALDMVCMALDVPAGVLTSEESKKRAAAAQLARRMPVFANSLWIFEQPDHTPDQQVLDSLTGTINSLVRAVELVSTGWSSGQLDPLLGGFPSPDSRRPWELLHEMAHELSRDMTSLWPSYDVVAATVDDALATAQGSTTAPSDPRRLTFATYFITTLVRVLAEWVGRKGWPLSWETPTGP